MLEIAKIKPLARIVLVAGVIALAAACAKKQESTTGTTESSTTSSTTTTESAAPAATTESPAGMAAPMESAPATSASESTGDSSGQ
ncbi:hypothetical protein [Acidithiobacillus sp.]